MRWLNFSFAVFVSVGTLTLCHAAPRQQTSPSASAYNPKYLEQIPLRYTDPDVIAKTLNNRALPQGVIRVQVDPKAAHTLRVLGTQEGIETIRAVVTLLDVKQRKGKFRVTIEKVRYTADGKIYTTSTRRKTLLLANNIPESFSLTDATGATVAVALTARLPQDKEVPATLMAQFGWREAKGSSVGLQRALPMPTGPGSKRVMGLTFMDGADIIGTVGVGNTPTTWKGAFTAYYLALEPISLSQ